MDVDVIEQQSEVLHQKLKLFFCPSSFTPILGLLVWVSGPKLDFAYRDDRAVVVIPNILSIDSSFDRQL